MRLAVPVITLDDVGKAYPLYGSLRERVAQASHQQDRRKKKEAK